jgi:hypothetical protein
MELHRSYVERYQGLDEIERLGDAAQSLWSFDEEGNSKPAGPERVDDLAPLYRSAFDAIRALEDAFFDDMRVAVGGEGRNEIIERLRRSRMREMYIQPGENAIMFGGTKVGGVDVVELVRELELDVAQRESVRPILERYERESLALLERRWEAGFDLQKASMRLTFAIRSQESDGSFEPMAYQQLQQEIVQPASKRFDDADAAVGQLNRSVLAELRDALPRAQAQALRQAHDRKAFPRIYDDPVNVDEELTAALELPDLTTEQRDQLRNLAAGYRPEYEEACHQMVELKSEHGRSMTSIQTNEWQDMQEYFQQMQKLQFERNELNFRTINRMKAILNEDQIKRIGGLPEPGEQDENPYIW